MNYSERDTKGFANRLNKALDAVGAPPLYHGRIDFLRRLYEHAAGEKLAPESLHRWLKGDALPQTRRIEQLVKLLEVDGEYLLTGRSGPERISEPGPSPIDSDETDLLHTYRQLDPKSRKLARRIIEQMTTTDPE